MQKLDRKEANAVFYIYSDKHILCVISGPVDMDTTSDGKDVIALLICISLLFTSFKIKHYMRSSSGKISSDLASFRIQSRIT